METEKARPGVGLSIILTRKDKIGPVLLGLRKGSHGEGTWAFPGGHIELWEQFDYCARREVKEETGLDLISLSPNPVAVTNDIFMEHAKHYITLFMTATCNSKRPRVMEPDKCEEWRWYEWQELPELNLFIPVENLLKQGYNPFI